MKGRKVLAMLLAMVMVLACVPAMAVEQGAQVPEGSWTAAKNEPHTITWFVAYDWFGTVFDPVNNEGCKVLLADTGITLEFSSGDMDKLNMLITTGNLPDVITMEATATQRKMLEDAGALEPLEPLIKEYAPDMNVPQSMLDWYRNDNGNTYSLASFYYGDERTSKEYGGMYVTHNKNFARSDILEQIGMTYDELNSKEGMLKALRAVKEKNIQYNGKAVIPYGSFDAASMMDLEMLSTQFGWQPENKDGTLNTLRRAPEYLEALLWLNTLYNEGLMTDEVFTWNDQQRNEAVASGSVFAGTGWTGIHRDARKALYAADNNAKMLFAGRMDADNKDVYYSGINCAGWTSTMMNAKAEHKDRIIQLFSYLTSDVSTLNVNYGTNVYDIVDGKMVMKPEVQAEFDADPTLARAKYVFDFAYLADWTIIQKYWPDPVTTNEVELDIQKAEMEKDLRIYDNKCFVALDPDAGTDLAAKWTIIDDQWKQQLPQMIMAPTAEECEAMWKSTLEEIDKLGFPEIEAYRQKKFDMNKARLGLEFAYPGNR
ncbi:MAG: extracellular solute-binding protein [Clostridia bacterium]